MVLERHQPSRSCKWSIFDSPFKSEQDLVHTFSHCLCLSLLCSHLTANKLTGELPKDFFELADTLERLYSKATNFSSFIVKLITCLSFSNSQREYDVFSCIQLVHWNTQYRVWKYEGARWFLVRDWHYIYYLRVSCFLTYCSILLLALQRLW